MKALDRRRFLKGAGISAAGLLTAPAADTLGLEGTPADGGALAEGRA